MLVCHTNLLIFPIFQTHKSQHAINFVSKTIVNQLIGEAMKCVRIAPNCCNCLSALPEITAIRLELHALKSAFILSGILADQII